MQNGYNRKSTVEVASYSSQNKMKNHSTGYETMRLARFRGKSIEKERKNRENERTSFMNWSETPNPY